MDVIANKEFMKCIRYVCPQKTVTATGASTAPTPTPHPGTALLGVCHDGGCLLARLSCHSCLAFVCLSGKGLPYEPHKLPKNYHMTQQSHCFEVVHIIQSPHPLTSVPHEEMDRATKSEKLVFNQH